MPACAEAHRSPTPSAPRATQLLDFGTNEAASVDYPDFAHLVADAVAAGTARFGILVCGSGIGMAIAANRHPGIRSAVLHDTTEARLTRAHNNANIASFGARIIGPEVALDALRVFLATPYEGGRHDRRLAKLDPAVAGARLRRRQLRPAAS